MVQSTNQNHTNQNPKLDDDPEFRGVYFLSNCEGEKQTEKNSKNNALKLFINNAQQRQKTNESNNHEKFEYFRNFPQPTGLPSKPRVWSWHAEENNRLRSSPPSS